MDLFSPMSRCKRSPCIIIYLMNFNELWIGLNNLIIFWPAKKRETADNGRIIGIINFFTNKI